MKTIYMLIIMLVGMAIGGEWQKPASNLTAIKSAIKSKTLTVEKIEKCDRYGYNAIHLSTFTNNNGVLKALLSSGMVDSSNINIPNDFGETPLILLNPANVEGLKMLLNTGMYNVQMLNQPDEQGNTFLMYCANAKNEVAAKMILNAGKFTPDDLEKKNIHGESFLSYCQQNGLVALASEAKTIAHKNTLATLTVVQSAIPMLVRGK
jgi:ankyrin repeat protein